MTPITLHNDTDLRNALTRMNELWGATVGTPEGDELDALADAIESYEKRVPVPAPDPAEIIRFKLQELGWSQNKLAKRAGLTSGRVSELLNGQRAWTMDHVRSVAHALGIAAGLLLGDTAPGRQVEISEHALRRLVALSEKLHNRFDRVVEHALTVGIDELEAQLVIAPTKSTTVSVTRNTGVVVHATPANRPRVELGVA